VLGGIDLDPATTKEANRVVKAARIYTRQDDGLQRQWRGRVWLNPPYAQPLIAEFIAKLVAEREAARVAAAIMLTHNCTDTAWFHDAAAAAAAICFTRGRVNFYQPDRGIAAPTQGQAFFYFGDDAARFADVFAGQVGLLVQPC
jgi:phage N-6-adenine-methyltransferase